jgi:hypothetical protein
MAEQKITFQLNFFINLVIGKLIKSKLGKGVTSCPVNSRLNLRCSGSSCNLLKLGRTFVEQFS